MFSIHKNDFSLVQLTKLALPEIIKAKGTVVNVSSINGPCPVRVFMLYLFLELGLYHNLKPFFPPVRRRVVLLHVEGGRGPVHEVPRAGDGASRSARQRRVVRLTVLLSLIVSRELVQSLTEKNKINFIL